MSKLLDYIRLSFFAAGLLLGVQIPAFVSDFGHALDAHLIEANNTLAPFKKDAQNYFNNDLNKLIAHYENIGDDIVDNDVKGLPILKASIIASTLYKWQLITLTNRPIYLL